MLMSEELNWDDYEKIVEEKIRKVILDDEIILAIKYESSVLYNITKNIVDVLGKVSFSDSCYSFDVYAKALSDIIEDSDILDISRIECEYSDEHDYPDSYYYYRINISTNSIFCYTSSGPVLSIGVEISSKEEFDPNGFIERLKNEIDSYDINKIYKLIEEEVKYSVCNKGDYDYLYSKLDKVHLEKIIELHQDKHIYPYLGDSDIQELNKELIDEIKVGETLSIEHKKDFVCGDQAVYVKCADGYLGRLPEDFGRFLCPGLDSGDITVFVKVIEIETDKYITNLKYTVDKKTLPKARQSKEFRVCVHVCIENNNNSRKFDDITTDVMKNSGVQDYPREYILNNDSGLYLLVRNENETLEIKKFDISQYLNPEDSNSIIIPKTVRKIPLGLCYRIKDINVYDTITPHVKGKVDTMNGLPNSNVGWIGIQPSYGYTLCAAERNSWWEPHSITVRSAETDQILYKVWMKRDGIPRDYYCRLSSSWGDNASFDFLNVDKQFKKLKYLEDKSRYALYRLQYPYELSEERKQTFDKYLKKNKIEIIKMCIEIKDMTLLKEFDEFIDISGIDNDAKEDILKKIKTKKMKEEFLSYFI